MLKGMNSILFIIKSTTCVQYPKLSSRLEQVHVAIPSRSRYHLVINVTLGCEPLTNSLYCQHGLLRLNTKNALSLHALGVELE